MLSYLEDLFDTVSVSAVPEGLIAGIQLPPRYKGKALFFQSLIIIHIIGALCHFSTIQQILTENNLMPENIE